MAERSRGGTEGHQPNKVGDVISQSRCAWIESSGAGRSMVTKGQAETVAPQHVTSFISMMVEDMVHTEVSKVKTSSREENPRQVGI